MVRICTYFGYLCFDITVNISRFGSKQFSYYWGNFYLVCAIAHVNYDYLS